MIYQNPHATKISAFKQAVGLRKLHIGREDLYPFSAGSGYFMSETLLNDQSALEEVSVGNYVTSLGYWVFNNAPKLKTVISYALQAPQIKKETFSKISPDAVLKYPKGCDYSAWLPYFSRSETFTSTGIDNIVIEEGNTTHHSPIYDLQGRMVCPNSDTTGLPKGVYIVGGKKIVVE